MASSALIRPLTCFIAPLLLAWSLLGCTHPVDPAGFQTAVIAGRTFHLELALDDDHRIQGLSDRKDIAADGGMLFVFPQPYDGAFVMRKCLVPIDLLYLDPSGYIITTHEMTVEPYDTKEEDLKQYVSAWPYQLVIELRAGTIRELHLQKAQKIDLPTEDLKARAR